MSALIEKLAKAVDSVGGSLKADKTNSEQRYDYVSADKILSVCGQALSKQGVMIIPAVTKWEISTVDRGAGKNPRYDVVVDLLLKVTDGETTFEEPWFGMGSDYQVPDKALYKAITSGHKYFISKLFCIGEGNEDGEHDEPEGQPTKQPANGKPVPAPTLKPLTKPEPITATVPTMSPVAQATIEAFTGEPVQGHEVTMTLEQAMSELTRENVTYGSIETPKLALMSNSLMKVLRGTALSAEDRAEKERKHAAISIILAHRENTAQAQS